MKLLWAIADHPWHDEGAAVRIAMTVGGFEGRPCKGAQARGVTITQMYNLREKLKGGEAFTEKERTLHEAAQTSILAQLHDELDAAVIEAYGWN